MRTLFPMISLGALLLAVPFASAQRPPGGPPGGGGPGGGLSKSAEIDDLVTRMMAFDQDKDGKLARSEVTDRRLLGLFDRADTDKDGTVTKAELTTLAEKEYVDGGSGGPGGPGGFGGPGGGPGGFGGPGGPGGFGGPPPRPGEVLSSMVQQRLELSAEQKAQIAALQAEVDGKLEKILNEAQKAQLKQMRERGPGGPGGGPRRGGPPGGGPPGGGPRGGPPRD